MNDGFADIECPECGSYDTRTHGYEEDTVACNSCGALFTVFDMDDDDD